MAPIPTLQINEERSFAEPEPAYEQEQNNSWNNTRNIYVVKQNINFMVPDPP